MRLNVAPFVALIAFVSACVVSSTNDPPRSPPPNESGKSVPPGQIRSAEVHERNAERKAEKDEKKEEKKDGKKGDGK